MTIEVHQSQLTKYLRCKRQWMFEEPWNLRPAYPPGEPKPPPEPASYSYGTAAHAGLEVYYLGGGSVEIATAIAASVRRMGEIPEGEVPSKEWSKVYRVARSMVEGYIEWVEREGYDLGLHTLGVEETIEGPEWEIHGESVRFVGTIDRRYYDELSDQYGIADHKSVDKLSQVPRPGDFQLRHYAWVLRELGYPGPVTTAHHNLLRRADRTHPRSKPPYFDRIPVNISTEALNYHSQILNKLIRDYVRDFIDLQEKPKLHVVRAMPNMTTECSWRCRNFALCDMMQDGDWLDVIEDGYHYAKEVRFGH